uniref:Uncharacterized protein n=1 Tax=Anopheles culicifacies TaxID=139723 RepID=A0A182MRD4_9DIPT
MMSPESNGEQEHGTVFPVSVAVSPSALKRMRYASVDEDASHGSSVSDVAKALNYTGSSACAKDRSYSGDAFEDDEYDGGVPLECTAGSDRSSSSCTTVIYGAGGKCAEPIDNNNSPLSGNNNNSDVSGTGGSIGSVAGGVIGGILHNNNNNSIKTRPGEMDEAKFSEFSKFLADSEKDESMATILELLHGECVDVVLILGKPTCGICFL